MKEAIKELRVKIDGLAQLTLELKPITTLKHSEFSREEISTYNTWEITKTTDSLYLAKAWLGKVLEELGTENPYESGYKTKEDIEPTADKVGIDDMLEGGRPAYDYCNMNHIEKVDWLRTEIQYVINFVKTHFDYCIVDKSSDKHTREFAIARTNCYTHLCEARFNLGFKLAKIKTN